MTYAELERDGAIVEKGIFLSLSEFAPYYLKGWRGAAEVNSFMHDAWKLGFLDQPTEKGTV